MPSETPLLPQPNIVVITCHDLGRHLGCYGIPGDLTPNLDRLANEGLLCTGAHSVSPGCSPSRAALFTGRLPVQNGVLGLTHGDFGWSLHDEEIHLATRLSHAGYATALAGGFHEETPARFSRLGYHHVATPNATHRGGLGWVPCHETTDQAIGLINHLASQNSPFFLCIGYFEPHRPFDFGGLDDSMDQEIFIPPWIPQESEAQRRAATEEFTKLQNAIRRVDREIGRFLTHLDASGLSENTVILFTSDHGLAMPGAKCTLHEAGTGVALIARAPSWQIPAGKRVEGLMMGTDVLPTLLEGAGIELPSNLAGVSQLSYWQGKSSCPRNVVHTEKHFHGNYDPIRSIRTMDFRYTVNFEFKEADDVPSDVREGAIYRESLARPQRHRPRFELYDLHHDPDERQNLSGNADFSEIEQELRSQLFQWMQTTEDYLLKGPACSPYYREQLRILSKRD